MAGGLVSFWPPAALRLFLVVSLLFSSPAKTLNLQASNPTVYSEANGSYFGFALDFYQDKNGRMNVVVGAPRANTSQPVVIEAGSVYLCPWVANGSKCTPLVFDAHGDQTEELGSATMKTFKSKQWFGASVNTWNDTIMACAPFQHWNYISGTKEATKTPVGSCFLASKNLQHFSEYSPCRDNKIHSVYISTLFVNDRRYCEIGFSLAISDAGRVLLGAPGGYYFGGLIYSVSLSAIQASFPLTPTLLWTVEPQQVTDDSMYSDYEDTYQGYSVAFGEFNEDPESPEYVVGTPNKSQTQGAVEILSWKNTFHILWTIPSEQIASYFGHTVAVADVNGDGKDDILVGAPLFLERRADRKVYEVGRVYLYLQQKTRHAYSTPWQILTGTDVYGRFGMAIAPLGDVNQDGYTDIAIGAPFAGQEEGGRVYIYCGRTEGLSISPDQILENPFSGPAGFGFAIRGGSDIDANGYPDVLVGAYRASKVAVYRAQPVVTVKAQVLMPDALNPENKTCTVSGPKVSCFIIKVCIGVSGKHIPQKIDLHAKLQLDRMKQKFGRRVFFLETSQSSRTLLLELTRNIPQTCKNFTAYLQNETEFKDKLSPIVVSLSSSLSSTSEVGALKTVLCGQTTVQEQTRIALDCGKDNICTPDLKLSAHMTEGFLLIGAENVVHIQATAVNAGEGAYEAELVLELPYGAYFQRANSSAQNLICTFQKENKTHVVLCEVGNPMKANTEIKIEVELSVSHLEEVDIVTFLLQLKSKNSHNPNSNVEQLLVPVKADAKMELLGTSVPAAIVRSLVTGDHMYNSMQVDDYGPQVEHIYQLRNTGPSTVSGAELTVDFPNTFRGGFLLYITRVSTEGNITCFPTNETNPLRLEVHEPTAAPSHRMTAQPHRRRERRAVSPATVEEPTVVNCSSQVCAATHCQVGPLESGQGALVTIHAVLWLPSFEKHSLEQFLIQSQATFNTSGVPYHVQPENLPSGSSQAETLVEWVDPNAERNIPVGWIIAAVLTGLLLLAATMIILWRMGFFKRKRPPAEEEEEEEEEEELTHDPGEQPSGEGQ